MPYSSYQRFHEVMDEDSAQTVVASLISDILPLEPGLVESLQSGIEVLDVGCGSSRVINLMASTFFKSRFTGYDLSEEAVILGRLEADKSELINIKFEQKDLTTSYINEHYDLITAFDAIHDQAHPDKVLAAIAEALNPEGIFLMQDIATSSHMPKNCGHPEGPLLYTISCMHCMSVSLAQNGVGLGAMWGREKATEMLQEAGFCQIEIKRLPHDFQNNYFIVRKR